MRVFKSVFHLVCHLLPVRAFMSHTMDLPSPVKQIPLFTIDQIPCEKGQKQAMRKQINRRNKHGNKKGVPVMKYGGLNGEEGVYRIFTRDIDGVEFSMKGDNLPVVRSNVYGFECGEEEIWNENPNCELTRRSLLLLLGHELHDLHNDGKPLYDWKKEFEDNTRLLEDQKRKVEEELFGNCENMGIFHRFKNTATANTSISTRAPSHLAPNGIILFGPNELAKDFVNRSLWSYSEGARYTFLDLMNNNSHTSTGDTRKDKEQEEEERKRDSDNENQGEKTPRYPFAEIDQNIDKPSVRLNGKDKRERGRDEDEDSQKKKVRRVLRFDRSAPDDEQIWKLESDPYYDPNHVYESPTVPKGKDKRKVIRDGKLLTVVFSEQIPELLGITPMAFASVRSTIAMKNVELFNGPLGGFVTVNKEPVTEGGHFHSISEQCTKGTSEEQHRMMCEVEKDNLNTSNEFLGVVARIMGSCKDIMLHYKLVCVTCNAHKTHLVPFRTAEISNVPCDTCGGPLSDFSEFVFTSNNTPIVMPALNFCPRLMTMDRNSEFYYMAPSALSRYVLPWRNMTLNTSTNGNSATEFTPMYILVPFNREKTMKDARTRFGPTFDPSKMTFMNVVKVTVPVTSNSTGKVTEYECEAIAIKLQRRESIPSVTKLGNAVHGIGTSKHGSSKISIKVFTNKENIVGISERNPKYVGTERKVRACDMFTFVQWTAPPSKKKNKSDSGTGLENGHEGNSNYDKFGHSILAALAINLHNAVLYEDEPLTFPQHFNCDRIVSSFLANPPKNRRSVKQLQEKVDALEEEVTNLKRQLSERDSMLETLTLLAPFDTTDGTTYEEHATDTNFSKDDNLEAQMENEFDWEELCKLQPFY